MNQDNFIKRTNLEIAKQMASSRDVKDFVHAVLIIAAVILTICTAIFIGSHFESLLIGIVAFVISSLVFGYIAAGICGHFERLRNE